MNNNVSVLKLLNSPLEYWLNIQDKKKLEELKDNNGLTVMHWAIINQNMPKIKELIALNFDLINVYSNNNRLPVKKLTEINQKPLDKIHNIDKFSAMQLCMFLVDYYESKEDKSHDFKIDIAYKYYLSMFAMLIEDMDILNKQNRQESDFSLLDYAFILENSTLINMLVKKDRCYSSLNKINSNVALKILETMKVKYTKLNSAIDNLSKELKIKDNYLDLNNTCNTVCVKNNIKKSTKL